MLKKYRELKKLHKIKPFVLKCLCKSLIDIVYIIAGVFILPIAVLFVKPAVNKDSTSNQEKFAWNWVDKIYGNRIDGFGDVYFRRDYPKSTYLSKYIWSAWRNPIHNRSLDNGVVNKRIIKTKIYGNPFVTDDPCKKYTGTKIQICTDEYGEEYSMLYVCALWRYIIPFYKGDRGIRFLCGYKNFNVKHLNAKYSYSFTVSFNPCKQFIKG